MTQVVEKQEVSNDFELINNNFEGLIQNNYTLCNQKLKPSHSNVLHPQIYSFNIFHEVVPLMMSIMSEYFISRYNNSAITYCIDKDPKIRNKFNSIPLVDRLCLTAILDNSYRNNDIKAKSNSREDTIRLTKEGMLKDIDIIKNDVLSFINRNLSIIQYGDLSFNIYNILLNAASIAKEDIENVFSGQKILDRVFGKLPTRVGKGFYIGNHYLYSLDENNNIDFHIAPAISIDDFYYHFSRNSVALPVDTTRVVYLIDSELFKEDYPYSSVKKYFDDIFLPEILKYNTTIAKVPSDFITMIHKSKEIAVPKNIIERKKMKSAIRDYIKNQY